jgi:putative membrane protein
LTVLAETSPVSAVKSDGNAAGIFALERPDPALWKLYVIRAILSGPGIVFAFPYLYFRYHTLRYRFDDEGIHMKVGILFRREVNLTYARIQDIHLRSGFIQRWLGLADVQVQTASGNAGAELVIEGFREYEQIRDFLYTRMRGARGGVQAVGTASESRAAAGEAPAGMVEVLAQIRDELRRTREALEGKKGGGDV